MNANQRFIIKLGITTALLLIVNQFLSTTHSVWLIGTAFLMLLTTVPAITRQTIILISVIILAAMLHLFMQWIFPSFLINSVISTLLILIITYYLLQQHNDFNQNKSLFAFLLFFLIAYTSIETASFYHIFIDIIFGAIIGFILNRLLFAKDNVLAFKQGLLPLLHLLAEYTQTLSQSFQSNFAHPGIAQKQYQAFNQQFISSKHYPQWVYVAGFNPGLAPGFRYFLIHLERILESVAAIHYLIQQPSVLNNPFQEAHQLLLSEAIEKNHLLIDLLITFFEKNEYAAMNDDLKSDLNQLERNLQAYVPNQLALLELSPDYLTMTELIRNIKDMRRGLLQLIMGLPAARVAENHPAS